MDAEPQFSVPVPLVRAVADLVAPTLSALAAGVPVEEAHTTGGRGLYNPLSTPADSTPPLTVEQLLALTDGFRATPPNELLAHPALVGTDRAELERQMSVQRRFRERSEAAEAAGTPIQAVWQVREIPLDAPLPPPPPDPIAGARALITALVGAVADNPAVAELLDAAGATTETEIAAQRGSTAIALGMAVAALVQRAIPGFADDQDLRRALAWQAYAAATQLLESRPAPAGYADAVHRNLQQSYTFPQTASATITAEAGHLALAEGFPAASRRTREAAIAAGEWPGTLYGAPDLIAGTPDFTDNGLVALVEGAVLIRTGGRSATCDIDVEVVAADPGAPDITGDWDEIVDITWIAREGAAVLLSSWADNYPHWVPVQTPPWPGRYRVRVHARRRPAHRGDPGPERYRVTVWPAGPATGSGTVVHKRTDDIGRRLRGEPDLPRLEGPVSGNWTGEEMGATITVVTGYPRLEDVLVTFGVDPSIPVTGAALYDNEHYGELVMARAVNDVVLVLEPNGFRGCDYDLLENLSGGGNRAASWFWNVNGMTCLGLAADGTMLASFEPGIDTTPAHPALGALWDDIDFDNYDIGKDDQALAVIERFTGWRWSREDLHAFYDLECGYLLTGGVSDANLDD